MKMFGSLFLTLAVSFLGATTGALTKPSTRGLSSTGGAFSMEGVTVHVTLPNDPDSLTTAEEGFVADTLMSSFEAVHGGGDGDWQSVFAVVDDKGLDTKGRELRRRRKRTRTAPSPTYTHNQYQNMLHLIYGSRCRLCPPDDDRRHLAESDNLEAWEDAFCTALTSDEDFPQFKEATDCSLEVDMDHIVANTDSAFRLAGSP